MAKLNQQENFSSNKRKKQKENIANYLTNMLNFEIFWSQEINSDKHIKILDDLPQY